MAQKNFAESTEIAESNKAIEKAVTQLRASARGRRALSDFKEMWLGQESGQGAVGFDSQNHNALFRLMIEAHGGRRDFIQDL